MQVVPSLALHGQRGSAAEIVTAASATPVNPMYLLIERTVADRSRAEIDSMLVAPVPVPRAQSRVGILAWNGWDARSVTSDGGMEIAGTWKDRRAPSTASTRPRHRAIRVQ